MLGAPSTFPGSTYLTGTWRAVEDARPAATGGWHGPRQRFSRNEALRDDDTSTRVDAGVLSAPVQFLGLKSSCFPCRGPRRAPVKTNPNEKSRRRVTVRELPDRTAAPSTPLVAQGTAKAGSGNSGAVLRIGLILHTPTEPRGAVRDQSMNKFPKRT